MSSLKGSDLPLPGCKAGNSRVNDFSCHRVGIPLQPQLPYVRRMVLAHGWPMEGKVATPSREKVVEGS